MQHTTLSDRGRLDDFASILDLSPSASSSSSYSTSSDDTIVSEEVLYFKDDECAPNVPCAFAGGPVENSEHQTGWEGSLRSSPYKKHERFHFLDGNVTLLVEGVLYLVHRYFLVRDSPWFSALLDAAEYYTQLIDKSGREHTASSKMYNSTRDTPFSPGEDASYLPLDAVKGRDFDALLSLLYPLRFDSEELTTIPEWISVLKLSSRWSFASLHRLSQKRLSNLPLEPVDQLLLGSKYSIPDWVISAQVALCARLGPLRPVDVRRLEPTDVALILDVKRKLQRSSSEGSNRTSITMAVVSARRTQAQARALWDRLQNPDVPTETATLRSRTRTSKRAFNTAAAGSGMYSGRQDSPILVNMENRSPRHSQEEPFASSYLPYPSSLLLPPHNVCPSLGKTHLSACSSHLVL